MDMFRTSHRKETMFWLNIGSDEDFEFQGTIGIDDPVTSQPRILLKYAILEEDSESEPLSSKKNSK